MILGLSSYTFGWAVGVPGLLPSTLMSEDDLLDLTLQQGLSCLQIGDNLPLHAFSQTRLGQFRERLRDNHVRIEVGARGLTSGNLQRYLEICGFLDAPLLRFVIDDADYEPDSKTVVSIIKNHLSSLRKAGVKLGIENHDRFRAREIAAIMNAVDDEYAGICLDCVNSLGAGEGIEHVSEILAPFTINLHIKDYRIQRLPHKMGFIVEGCVAGSGMTDVPSLLDRIIPYGRCESAVLEQWVVPESSVDATIDKEKKWALKGLEYLKQLPIFRTNS